MTEPTVPQQGQPLTYKELHWAVAVELEMRGGLEQWQVEAAAEAAVAVVRESCKTHALNLMRQGFLQFAKEFLAVSDGLAPPPLTAEFVPPPPDAEVPA